MSAVVDFVEDVVGGVVEAVGDVVESVVDVVKDVGSAIDDYVIQPILDDPLTAVATMAGAAFLGPAIAPMLGTGLGAATGYVATGLGAAAGNTAAGLAQGEDFDEAVKGGLLAGVTAGATSAGFDYLTGAGAFGPEGAGGSSTAAAAAPDEALASSAATPDEFLSSSASPVAEAFPVAPRPEIVATDLPPLTSIADDALTSGASGTSSAAASIADDPLGEFIKNLPGMTDDAVTSAASTSADPLGDFIAKLPGLSDDALAVKPPEITRDWLTEGVKFPKTDGIAAREIPLDTPLKYNLDGSVNYDLMAGIPQSSPIGFKPGGGAGLNVQVDALPDFKYSMDSLDPSIRGMGDVWTGESGKLYGTGTPEGIITETGFQPLPTQLATTGPSTTAGGTAGAGKTLGDKLKNFEFGDISLTDVGKAAMNYAVENPLTTLAAATLATGVLTGAGAPPAGAGGPPAGGGTRDENFNRPLDMYNYMRDLQAYGGDLTRYGERPGGEHRFFVNTRFEPVPIPTTPPPGNKTGGLIQYKQHLADGGIAGPQSGQMPQTPQNSMSQREAIMAAMQQRAAMAKRQGALAQMQGGMPGGMPMAAPGRAPQGMQGMMPQQQPARQGPINRNPKTAYYQYGTPPAMAMGGALNMVRSMNIGGGADGRSDDVDALLSDGEYVIDAETVALLGNGSSEAGAKRLDQMRSGVRQHKGKNLSKGKISPNAKSPLAYMKGA